MLTGRLMAHQHKKATSDNENVKNTVYGVQRHAQDTTWLVTCKRAAKQSFESGLFTRIQLLKPLLIKYQFIKPIKHH